MMKQRKKALIVLGMPKSGISTLTGCLNILGLNTGNKHIGENPDDQPNYHDITLMHDLLFRNLGCKWDMIGSLPSDWLIRDETKEIQNKITRLIEDNFTESEYLIIHDPRLCRLIPMWMDIFKQNEIEPLFIHMVRHPFEVAKSLNDNEGFDLMKSHLLWLNYNREALSATRDNQHLVITYDGLLADPINCMENIRQEFELDIFSTSKKKYKKIIDFVISNYKHHHLSELNDSSNNKYEPYAWIYNQLRLYQVKQLHYGTDASPADGSMDKINADNDLMKTFPLVNTKNRDIYVTKPEVMHASDIIDNMLSIISKYEQADLNRNIQRQRLLLTADHNDGSLYSHCFFPSKNGSQDYIEEKSEKTLLAHNEWQKISIPIPDPVLLRSKPIRFVPINRKGFVNISAINLIEVTGKEIWSSSGDSGFKNCIVEGETLILNNSSSLEICITGKNQHIILPIIPNLPDTPIILEIWIKVLRDLVRLHPVWREREEQLQILNKKNIDIESKLNQSEEERNKKRLQIESLVQQNEIKLADHSSVKELQEKEINELKRQLQDQKSTYEQKNHDLDKKLNEALIEKQKNENDISQLSSKLDETIEKYELQTTQKDQLIEEYFSELTKTESSYSDQTGQLKLELNDQRQINSEQMRQLKEKEESLARALSEYAKIKNFYYVNFIKLTNLMGISKCRDSLSLSSETIFTRKAPVDAIHSIFSSINTVHSTNNSNQFMNYPDYLDEDLSLLKTWIQQLNRESKVLIRSVRWPIGNGLALFLTLGLCKIWTSNPMRELSDLVQKIESQPYNDENTYEPLLAIIDQIRLNVDSLIHSYRWRFGHKAVLFYRAIQFKKNPPWATQRIKTTLNQFNDTIPFSTKQLIPNPIHPEEEMHQLKTSIQRLNRESNVLIRSVRWPIGNALAVFFTLGLCKFWPSDPMNKLVHMVRELDSQAYVDENSYESLLARIHEIRFCFESLINSYRWRIGHKAVILYRIIQFKKNPPWATQRIEAILNEFDA